MNDLDARTDVEVLKALEFTIPCESHSHHKGQYGHIPEQAAEWSVTAPCGVQLLLCTGWVNTAIAGTYSRCACTCGVEHRYHEYRYVPLGDAHD